MGFNFSIKFIWSVNLNTIRKKLLFYFYLKETIKIFVYLICHKGRENYSKEIIDLCLTEWTRLKIIRDSFKTTRNETKWQKQTTKIFIIVWESKLSWI